MKKQTIFYLLTALGVGMLVVGLWLIKAGQSGSVVAYLCVGIGCGMFGHGVGELIRRAVCRRAPETARQMEIEQKDERNLALRDRAQAKAYQIMLPVFGALFFAFALMGVEMKVILLLVTAYLFVCGCSVYYRIKYEKEM